MSALAAPESEPAAPATLEIGEAPASPAGPVEETVPVRLPPADPAPAWLQTLRFGDPSRWRSTSTPAAASATSGS